MVRLLRNVAAAKTANSVDRALLPSVQNYSPSCPEKYQVRQPQ